MKELSIEEKAKAYDGAIERAKKWHNAPNIDKIPTYANRVIEDIFPELKENEDDENKRISKEITQFLKQNNGWNREWLKWLERQGQKPAFDIEIPFGAKDSELQEATYLIPEGFHAEIEGDKVVIKKGKQKHTWKPTKEQMSALDSTLQYGQVLHNSYEHLNSLYNDLKKL